MSGTACVVLVTAACGPVLRAVFVGCSYEDGGNLDRATRFRFTDALEFVDRSASRLNFDGPSRAGWVRYEILPLSQAAHR